MDTPDDRLTVTGFRLVVGPGGETVAVKPTVPAKPLELVRVTVDPPEVPAVRVRLFGLAPIVKSAGRVTVIIWIELALADVESVTFRVAVYDPAVEYECETGFPVALAPSPKLQLNE